MWSRDSQEVHFTPLKLGDVGHEGEYVLTFSTDGFGMAWTAEVITDVDDLLLQHVFGDADGNVYIVTQVDGVEKIQALSELLLRYSYGRVQLGHDNRVFTLRLASCMRVSEAMARS